MVDILTKTGWFADIDSDDATPPYIWQPCVQVTGGLCTSLQIWFASKEECLKFIREDILTTSHLLDEEK